MKKVCLGLALAGVFLVSQSRGVVINETFATNPLTNGWQTTGEASLFQWDSTNENLTVTWNSSLTNSYFYQPLGLTVPASKEDSFSIAFDLRIDDIGPTGPEKPFSFNLSIGLLNLGEATQPGFLRGTGFSSPDLAEFSYFWDSGFGATAWPVISDSSSSFNFNTANDYAVLTLTNGDWYHVCMTYSASNQMLLTTLTNLAQNTGVTITAPIAGYLADWAVDAISISSFNDTDGYDGSLLGHGAVDNLVVTVSPAPIKRMTGKLFDASTWQVSFLSQTNWNYILERTEDLSAWSDATVPTMGTGTNMILQDVNAPTNSGFYRVRAEKP